METPRPSSKHLGVTIPQPPGLTPDMSTFTFYFHICIITRSNSTMKISVKVFLVRLFCWTCFQLSLTSWLPWLVCKFLCHNKHDYRHLPPDFTGYQDSAVAKFPLYAMKYLSSQSQLQQAHPSNGKFKLSVTRIHWSILGCSSPRSLATDYASRSRFDVWHFNLSLQQSIPSLFNFLIVTFHLRDYHSWSESRDLHCILDMV